MESDRKRVAVYSSNSSLGGALRLLLDEHRVDLVSSPDDDVADAHVLVWEVEGSFPQEQLTAVAMRVPTLVLADSDAMLRAVDAGCRGFLPNSASLEEIRDAVTTIAEGGAVVHPELLGALLRHLVRRRRHDRERVGSLGELTEREREVFRLAARGARREEIAAELFISPATARTHLQRVYRKLEVHSQAELMALAMRVGDNETEEEW